MISRDSILKLLFPYLFMFHGLWCACGAFVWFLILPRRHPYCPRMESSTVTSTEWEEHPVSVWLLTPFSENSRLAGDDRESKSDGMVAISVHCVTYIPSVLCVVLIPFLFWGRSCSDFLFFNLMGIPDVLVNSFFLLSSLFLLFSFYLGHPFLFFGAFDFTGQDLLFTWLCPTDRLGRRLLDQMIFLPFSFLCDL